MKKSIFIAALGTLIEYYDYAILVCFLPFLAPTFFRQIQHTMLLLWVLCYFDCFGRSPIGWSSVWSCGDRFGRRTALLISLYGIAIATLIIGFYPVLSQLVWQP